VPHTFETHTHTHTPAPAVPRRGGHWGLHVLCFRLYEAPPGATGSPHGSPRFDGRIIQQPRLIVESTLWARDPSGLALLFVVGGGINMYWTRVCTHCVTIRVPKISHNTTRHKKSRRADSNSRHTTGAHSGVPREFFGGSQGPPGHHRGHPSASPGLPPGVNQERPRGIPRGNPGGHGEPR
jgi:hypothetical protein